LDGVLLFDGMNQIVYANATAEEIFGYERGTLTGVFLRDLIPVAMRGMHERAVAEFTQSGMSKRRMAPGREVVGLRADGTEFPIEAIISRADTGRRTYFTALVRDVSEERRQQAASKQQTSELVVAKEQAERASREKSDFLSRMSHEFRTPLNSILGYAQLLEIGSAEERREAAREILNAANYLLALVNELLDLGRVEAGKLEMNIGSVEVAATLRQAASMVAPLLEERGITLEQAIDAGIPPMLADATRLRQVLINLLSNAAKYNRQGGRIIVSCERRDPSLRINVQDEGPGIPPEKRARLFQPFERLGVDGSGVEGTGLGLALCQRLVDLMGGRVGVQSAPVQGSIFWLELPIAFAGAGKQDASQP
jgi:PAS domain S-box-containing protein